MKLMNNDDKLPEEAVKEADQVEETFQLEEEPAAAEEEVYFPISEPEAQIDESIPLPRISKPTNKEKKANTYVVGLPSDTLEKFTAAINRFSELFKEVDDVKKKWSESAGEAVEFYTPGGLYQNRINEPGSQWEQGVLNADGELKGMSSVAFKNQPGELKGEIALLKVAKRLGMGDVVNVMLPHSGIWVTVKPPTDREIIGFYNTVFREQIMFGNMTSGLTFSNFAANMNNRLFEFILRHVHGLNYSDLPKESLGNFMVAYDFPFLVHGLAKAMYANGFDYSRACTNNLQECLHVSEQTLDLDSMVYIDNSSLSKVQRNILSNNRSNAHTLESFRTFKAEHARMVEGSHRLSNGIKLNFKIPTFNEHVTDGLDWINNISSTVDNLITANNGDEEMKSEILQQYVKSTALRQFGYFIDSVEVSDDEVVNDRKTINSLLELFSSDDDIRVEITKAIIDYKSRTTYAVIGVDQYTCPACNHQQEGIEHLPAFRNVIPIDSVALFFLMLTSKISKILEREA